MRPLLFTLSLLCLITFVAAQAAEDTPSVPPTQPLAQAAPVEINLSELPVAERTLSNGLKVFVYERPEATDVACRITYLVGSADEWSGTTGVSHFCEHLMFKGSTTIGTHDYAKEIPLLKREDDLRETLQLLEDDARALDEMNEDAPMELLDAIGALRFEAGKIQKELEFSS